ncbi:MAG: MCE family protein [Acidimicrobiia bacterium]|nr:MCE family protein [Acidimicrobiia bacterium]
MISKRIVVNLLFFGLIGVSLLVWALTNVVSFDVVDRPYTLTAEFATSPGLSPRFEVTYLGQRVGSIRSVELEGDHVVVDMRIDRDVEVPAAIDAAVRRKSAVGEPYVDLFPTPGTDPTTGPRLAPDDRIPIARTSTPLAYSALFAAVGTLLEAVDPVDTATLLRELALALDGRGDSVRELLIGAEQITGDLADNAELLDQVIGDLTMLTDTFAEHSGSVGAGIDNLAVLSDQLAASQADLDRLLTDGPRFGEALSQVVTDGGASLGCTLTALGEVTARLDPETLEALRNLISLSPQFLFVLEGVAAPSQGAGGELFFNTGNGAQVPFYDDPIPLPGVPTVPSCTEVLAAPPPAVGDAAVAGPGEAGAAPTPDGVPGDETTTTTPGGVALPASSAQASGERFGLDGVLAVAAAMAAALAALVVGRWALVVRRQDGAGA